MLLLWDYMSVDYKLEIHLPIQEASQHKGSVVEYHTNHTEQKQEGKEQVRIKKAKREDNET